MTIQNNSAWLIGLYNDVVETRIEQLGFRITRFLATVDVRTFGVDEPALIVISDDGISDLAAFERLRDFYPDALMISVDGASDHGHMAAADASAKRSIARLVSAIYEREHRWDN